MHSCNSSILYRTLCTCCLPRKTPTFAILQLFILHQMKSLLNEFGILRRYRLLKDFFFSVQILIYFLFLSNFLMFYKQGLLVQHTSILHHSPEFLSIHLSSACIHEGLGLQVFLASSNVLQHFFFTSRNWYHDLLILMFYQYSI